MFLIIDWNLLLVYSRVGNGIIFIFEGLNIVYGILRDNVELRDVCDDGKFMFCWEVNIMKEFIICWSCKRVYNKLNLRM